MPQAETENNKQIKTRNAGMGFIMLTVLIDMLSIGLIIPVLPKLVGGFTTNPTENAFWYGAVVVTFAVANFISSPVLGALSDHYGRRPILLIGFCGLALNFFATAAATAMWMLIAVRILGGAMQANAAVANAYVADITEPEDRARSFGMLGAMFGLGFTLGPVAGGILGHLNIHLPFLVAGILSVGNLLYGYFVLPESLPEERRKTFSWRAANPAASFIKLSGLRGGGPLVVMIGLSGLAQFSMQTSWVLYGSFRFGWGPLESGMSLCAVGVVSVIVQGFLLKHMLAKFGAKRLTVIGLASGSGAYFLFGLATQGWMMYVVILMNLFAFGVSAAIQSLISNSVDARSQGQIQGAVASLNSLTAVVGQILGAGLMVLVSHLDHSSVLMGGPFFFCGVLQACAAVLSVRYVMTHREGQNAPSTVV